MRFFGIHLRPISQEVLDTSIRKIDLKNTLVKLLPNLPGATELTSKRSQGTNGIQVASPIPFAISYLNCSYHFECQQKSVV